MQCELYSVKNKYLPKKSSSICTGQSSSLCFHQHNNKYEVFISKDWCKFQNDFSWVNKIQTLHCLFYMTMHCSIIVIHLPASQHFAYSFVVFFLLLLLLLLVVLGTDAITINKIIHTKNQKKKKTKIWINKNR